MTYRLLTALAVVIVLLAGVLVRISRGEEYMAHFYQAEPPIAVLHEYQILEGEWVPISTVSTSVPCVGCWQQTIIVPQPGLLRVRAIGFDGQPSQWSRCPIAVPEPGVGVGLALVVLGLVGLAQIRADSSDERG